MNTSAFTAQNHSPPHCLEEPGCRYSQALPCIIEQLFFFCWCLVQFGQLPVWGSVSDDDRSICSMVVHHRAPLCCTTTWLTCWFANKRSWFKKAEIDLSQPPSSPFSFIIIKIIVIIITILLRFYLLLLFINWHVHFIALFGLCTLITLSHLR